MPEVKTFVDTHVIIYAYDVSAGDKHRAAARILSGLWESGNGMVSTQVLQEFFAGVTRNLPKTIEKDLAKDIVKDLLKWQVVVNTGEFILDAIDVCLRFGYSFWDAMIIEAAIKGGAALLLSENLHDGQVIGGVEIRNPFHARA